MTRTRSPTAAFSSLTTAVRGTRPGLLVTTVQPTSIPRTCTATCRSAGSSYVEPVGSGAGSGDPADPADPEARPQLAASAVGSQWTAAAMSATSPTRQIWTVLQHDCPNHLGL